MTRVRAVGGQFLFWVPILLLRLVSRDARAQRGGHSDTPGDDPEIESRIENLLSCFPTRIQRNEVREIAERYSALHSAMKDEGTRPSGQFELFAIAGNGNGSTGTPCLYRKNLSKLRIHKDRTTEDLILLARQNAGSSSARPVISELIIFFAGFGDKAAIEDLEVLNIRQPSQDPPTVRMAA